MAERKAQKQRFCDCCRKAIIATAAELKEHAKKCGRVKKAA